MADNPLKGRFGTVNDIDGSVKSAKVQSKGRINIPNPYLNHIGVEKDDEVFIIVDGDHLKIKKASLDNLAAVVAAKSVTAVYRMTVDGD